MFPLHSREQCEEFQMIRFGISCATCDRSDDECLAAARAAGLSC